MKIAVWFEKNPPRTERVYEVLCKRSFGMKLSNFKEE